MKKLFLFLFLAARVGAQQGAVTPGQVPPQQPAPAEPIVTAQEGQTFINAGSQQPVTDSTGQVWQPDTGLYNVGGPAACAPTSVTTGTPNPMLFLSARVGVTTGPMTYKFQGMASGAYQITLFFAECYWTKTGQRVFNVQMQNTTVFSNVDIFQAVGKNVAYQLTTLASVEGPTDILTISFLPIAGKNVPIIDAIQIQHVHTATLNWSDTINPPGTVTYNIYRSLGPCSAPNFSKLASGITGTSYVDATIAAQQGYCYQITAQAGPTESLPCTALYVPGSVSTCNCQ